MDAFGLLCMAKIYCPAAKRLSDKHITILSFLVKLGKFDLFFHTCSIDARPSLSVMLSNSSKE